jgi:hypothetical protein
MEEHDIPDSCQRGDHDFGQAGRCQECGIDRVDTYPDERRTGGAGARRQPTTDREYREQMRKLVEMAGK